MNGNACRHQLGLARCQRDGRINAGTQVEPGRTGRGVLRQLIAHARIKDFDVEFFHILFFAAEGTVNTETTTGSYIRALPLV